MHDYFLAASGGAVGVLGIGPNAPGKGPVVTAALPGNLSDGEFIRIDSANPANDRMGFGAPLDLDIGGGTSPGAPITTVQVQINDGPLQTVQATFDSGGLYGSIPSSIVTADPTGHVSPGTTISVYNTSGRFLYSYTVDAGDTPVVTSDAMMNTGIIPFTFSGPEGTYIDNRTSGGSIQIS